MCFQFYGIQVGEFIPGTMSVSFSNSSLPGYNDCGTIHINWNMQSGTQGPKHPTPGKPYSSTSR